MLSKLKIPHFYLTYQATIVFFQMLTCILHASATQHNHGSLPAVIVPMRNREHHLHTLLDRYTTFATEHKNHIIIIIAEQDDKERYNLGKSRNVGFLEAKKFYPSHVIFSDVDIWPKLDSIWTEMMTPPTRNTCKHFYYYLESIGGLFSFLIEDYLKTNGCPNNFFGWGGEDNVLALRTQDAGINRWLYYDGNFRNKQKKSFDVEESTPRDLNEERFTMVEQWQDNSTGLSDLDYTITKSLLTQPSPFITYYHVWFK